MGAMEMMGVMPILMYSIFSVIPLSAGVYLFLKWRAYRDNEAANPFLGAAVVFHYFKTMAWHIVLLGLVLGLFGALKGEYGTEVKIGLALFLAGGLVYALFFALRRRLPDAGAVVRVYSGFNLVATGILTMICLLACSLIIFNGSLNDLRLPGIGLLVYGLAALSQASRFLGFPRLGRE